MILRNQKFGFTLIELSVAISLLVVMLTLSTLVYRNASKRTELILTVQQLASNLRLAQTYAASAKAADADPSHNIWGLYFDEAAPTRIIMFSDKDKDGVYGGEAEKYKIIDLPNRIKLFGLFYKQGATSRQPLDGAVAVTFVAPDPKVRICQVGSGNCGASDWVNYWSEPWDDVYVVLTDELTNSVKDVNVNFFGLIDVR